MSNKKKIKEVLNTNKKFSSGVYFNSSDKIETTSEAFERQEEIIHKSEVNRVRSFAFERRARLPYLINKGLAKPGTISFDILRRAATSVHAARICINVLKEKITKTNWTIQPIDALAHVDQEKIDRVKKLFTYPNKIDTFRTLLDKMLEDLLVLDAVALEKTRDSSGEIDGIHFVDASTVRPVFDDHGNQDVVLPITNKDGEVNELPVSYVQVLDSNPYGGRESGEIVAMWPRKDIIYFCQHPQGSMGSFGYGLSPLESVVGVVANILNADNFNGTYFEEGAFPPIIIQLKQNMDQRELQAIREYMYNELEGRYHRPAIIGGDADMDVQNLQSITQRDMQFMEYMKFMVRLLAAAYGLSGQDVGLVDDLNRATSEVQKDLSQEKGYGSILHLLKEVFNNEIIWRDFGYTDIEFDWVATDTTDQKTLAETIDLRLKNGTLSINEARQLQGDETYGDWADYPLILTGTGYIPMLSPSPQQMQNTQNGNNGQEQQGQKEETPQFTKSIQTKDGQFEVILDDRGVSQPFIFHNPVSGYGRVIKPPVAVNLDSQKLEEEMTAKLFNEGLNVVPVKRVSTQDIINKILITPEVKKEFANYQSMVHGYDSKRWQQKFGGSRKFPYYIVSKYIEGRNLKDNLLIEDMKRVPNDYRQAIIDLANLWIAEKKYVLGDRRADQVIITDNKRTWGYDYQFVGNESRWKGTKDAYANALKTIPELHQLFLKLTGQESTIDKIKKTIKKGLFIKPDTMNNPTGDDNVMFGELVSNDFLKQEVISLFNQKSIALLLNSGFGEKSFYYDSDRATQDLTDFVLKNPKGMGGIIPQEDIKGIKYFIFTNNG